MLVLLKRLLFADGQRYRPSEAGTEVPNGTILPKDALVWDGTHWVEGSEADKIDFAALDALPTAYPGMKSGRQMAKGNVLEQRGATPKEKSLAARREDKRLERELTAEEADAKQASLQQALSERKAEEEKKHLEAQAKENAAAAKAKP